MKILFKTTMSTITIMLVAIFIVGCNTRKYTVSFYVDDKLFLETKVEPNESVEDLVTINNPELKLTKWKLDGKEYDFSSKVTKNIILKAETIDKLIINYYHDETIIFTLEAKIGSTIQEIDAPSVDGKKFIGWFVNDILFDFDEVVTTNLDLVAKYEEVENLKIEYYLEEKLFETVEVPFNSIPSEIKSPSLPDKVFLYWKDINGLKFNFDNYLTKDIKLYAHFKDEYDETYGSKSLDIYYLNDTHGAVLNDGSEIGLARIANLINTRRNLNPEDTLFLTGGDMFQGQLISNDSKGQIMVESLNAMGLDAFILGNHEFDWGIDVILNYFDNSTPGVKANFPLLAANVIDLRTNESPKQMKPYTIVEKNGSKIGIIGTIGDGLESSINYMRVKDYRFTDSLTAVKKYAKEIEDQVDLIIVGTHYFNARFNEEVSKLNKVGAIFNAHTHREMSGQFNNVPYLQSGNNGKMVGNMKLEYTKTIESSVVDSYTYTNIKSNPLLNTEDKVVSEIINNYYEAIRHLYDEVLITASEAMSKDVLARYIARLMKEVTGSILGLQNSGGTRDTFYKGQNITAADIFQVFPFDNSIIYTEVKGSYVKELLRNTYFTQSYDETVIKDNEYYKVATNDYVFFSPLNKFQENSLGDAVIYGDMYTVFLEVINALKDNGYTEFNSNSPILINRRLMNNKYVSVNNQTFNFI